MTRKQNDSYNFIHTRDNSLLEINCATFVTIGQPSSILCLIFFKFTYRALATLCIRAHAQEVTGTKVKGDKSCTIDF